MLLSPDVCPDEVGMRPGGSSDDPPFNDSVLLFASRGGSAFTFAVTQLGLVTLPGVLFGAGSSLGVDSADSFDFTQFGVVIFPGIFFGVVGSAGGGSSADDDFTQLERLTLPGALVACNDSAFGVSAALSGPSVAVCCPVGLDSIASLSVAKAGVSGSLESPRAISSFNPVEGVTFFGGILFGDTVSSTLCITSSFDPDGFDPTLVIG